MDIKLWQNDMALTLLLIDKRFFSYEKIVEEELILTVSSNRPLWIPINFPLWKPGL